MVQVLDKSFMVCDDCVQVIANGDYTGLDYHYDSDEADRRMIEINRGLRIAGGHVIMGDTDKDLEWSRKPCDCCDAIPHGRRFHCVVLGD